MSEKKLTKEQANELYDNLQKAMNQRMAQAQQGAQTAAKPSAAKVAPQAGTQAASQAEAKAAAKNAYGKSAPTAAKAMVASRSLGVAQILKQLQGSGAALLMVAFFGCAKITLSALEASGIGKVEEAQAVVIRQPVGPQWSKEEAKILTGLDARRVELEERSTRLEQRESDFTARERELAIRLTELKELSEKLKIEREKGDKQRSTQLDQLANVYGSMNPPEAAHLLEQLDIQVSLSLIERMPEKRIGQILSLMSPQRALELTNLLSQRKG